MQEVEHRHLQREIADRGRIVLGLHEIEPDHARIRRGNLEAREHLREHRLGNAGARHLRDVADGDTAARIGLARAAREQLALARFRLVETAASRAYHRVAEAGGEQAIAQLAEVRIPAGRHAARRADAAVRRQHQLEIADLLRGRPRGDLREHLPVLADAGPNFPKVAKK